METVDLTDTETVEAVEGVYLAQLAVGDEMSVQHFQIEAGAEVPEHEHHHEQVGYLYQGELTFVVDGEEHVVTPGESYTIPGGEAHAAVNEGDDPVRGIDVFSPPRANPDWLE
ncbi:cupin domain-containing protein [Halobacterium jilantaiense]|uniref:Cupin domain protein n=1 Tax=Halobacterium jilantaiense TaxID=355548 RepID=A0A1I0QIZ7_9EURY|nr:cupin domain-containing protein [Halobacterium jilantaiense]SEW26891.1 Cupin domain protein [Halobacterium jilantaiense]